jgi:hypothetical protein
VFPTSDETEAQIALIVSAAAVPMTIVDYRPIIERFAGCTVEEIKSLLSDAGPLGVAPAGPGDGWRPWI